jgi:two-component system, OmpR family, sensor kinase
MNHRIPRRRSLRTRLALTFLAITALALAVVTFVFLPQLENRIDHQKLDELQRTAARSTGRLAAVVGQDVTGPEVNRVARDISDRTGARVTLLGLQQSTRAAPRFYVVTDSNENASVAPNLSLAGSIMSGRTRGRSLSKLVGHQGEVLEPLYYHGQPAWVAIFTSNFGDVHQAVALIRDRLLIASAVALLVALLGGWIVARRVTSRVRRLERAARAVAQGRRVDPLPVEPDDELGRLTRAFNDMQDQLARVDHARREFIANASHELRTPIFSLGGFVELLQDEQLDQETRDEFLRTMAEQVARLQKLSVDLLDLSRIDAGSLELAAETVDLTELVGAVAVEFQPALVGHRTDLKLRLPEEPVEALCDRQRVTQIMRILLDNALRHTPEGTPVTVKAGRYNGTAEVSVSDRGPGVAPASRMQIFERFYTADAARGSGLGLAIAKELAERMDGQLTLNSRPGRTVFKIALPVAGDDGQPEA